MGLGNLSEIFKIKSTASELIFELHVFSKKKTFRFFKRHKFPAGCSSVSREFTVNPLQHKRLAIFAAFCPEGEITRAQLYYLKGLKEVADNIIFAADSPIQEKEIDKIKNLVCYCNFESHREYDFGSYKRGLIYALEKNLLNGIEELIICNDSCYAPIYPLKECFAEMESRKCDFWGMTVNYKIKKHIQSYFYVFKSAVFEKDYFKSFLMRVRRQINSRRVILKYEVRFTDYLSKKGLTYSSFVPENIDTIPNDVDKTLYPLMLAKEYRMPLAKIKTFNGMCEEHPQEGVIGAEGILEYIEKVNPVLAEIIKTSS